jgi:hypothetical protein
MLSSLLICAFDSLTDNRPTPYVLSWPNDFDEWKETPVKEDAALWSPVTYREGGLRVRGQTEANITQVHAVVLDYDSKQVPVTLEQAREVWQGWEHVGYTTFQHASDKPRFRIVLPLSRPVNTSEFRRIWAWVHALAVERGVPFDPLSDPGRIYFVPTHRPGAEHVFWHNAEEVLDADIILSVAPLDTYRPPIPPGARTPVGASSTAPSPSTGRTSLFSGIETVHQVENLERIEAQCAFMRHCREDAANLPENEWYAWLSILARCKDGNRHAHEIGSAYAGYSPAETNEKFQRAATETGPRRCDNIRTFCTACVGCPVGAPAGDVTSPVQLGRPDPVTATPEELRADEAARTESDLDRARAAVAGAEADVARLTVEESVARTRVANARRFGLEDTVRAETEAHVNLRADLATARNRLRTAQTNLRTAETQARRTANLTNADPRVLQQMMLDPRTGTPRASLANVEAVLRGDATAYPAGYFRYDSFAEKLYYRGAPAEDHFDTRINIDIERRYNIAPRTTTVQEAIVNIAKEDAFHPVRDYLNEHTWDGVSRLGDLFKVGFGATGDEGYLEDAATKFCIGAVARIFDPGCKMDNMIVITGPQGIGKSTAFNILAKGWFADSPLSIGDKDAFMQMAGKWFYELSELDSFRKAENTRIKAFLSSRFDTFRPPFGRHVVERPRQTVIVGTTNEDQFLNDPTGSRRFVPIRATRVDVPWLAANRDQLWAEAVVRYRAGEIWYYAGESAARLVKESAPFQQDDVWEPTVYAYVARLKNPTLHVLDVITGCLNIEVSRITRADKMRVLNILKGFGCTVATEEGAHKGMTVILPDAMVKAAALAKPTPAAPPAALPPVPSWVTGKPSTETH